MAVHELTTNALMYGALSVPEGNVTIAWSLDQEREGDRLSIEWIEANGPAVEAPKQRGVGMNLIERGLKQDLGAEVQVDFAKTGVRAKL
jgi:two-component sensor histidine kinase